MNCLCISFIYISCNKYFIMYLRLWEVKGIFLYISVHNFCLNVRYWAWKRRTFSLKLLINFNKYMTLPFTNADHIKGHTISEYTCRWSQIYRTLAFSWHNLIFCIQDFTQMSLWTIASVPAYLLSKSLSHNTKSLKSTNQVGNASHLLCMWLSDHCQQEGSPTEVSCLSRVVFSTGWWQRV